MERKEEFKNHIISQMFNDESVTEKKTLPEYINDIYKIYINTINNEEYSDKQLQYLQEKNISTSEVGIKINGNKLLHIGACKRHIYLKYTGAIGNEKEVDEVEGIERNKLTKDQWLRKFEFLKLILDDSVKEGKIQKQNMHSTNDCVFMDPIEMKEYVLIVKPVNDTAYANRDKIWPKSGTPIPLSLHIPEALALVLLFRKPVLMLYVGKNDTKLSREFVFGLKESVLTINGEKDLKFEHPFLLNEINDLVYAFENNKIPPRDYEAPKVLSQEEIDIFVEHSMINKKDVYKYANGELYQNFMCKSCKYSNICEAIGPGWCD